MTPIVPSALSLNEALQRAVAHLQAGQFAEAEQLYRAILDTHPQQPEANHNLGLLACHSGQVLAGLPYLRTALAANPNQEGYAMSYAEALLVTDQAGEALIIIKEAMQRGLNTSAALALRQKIETATQVVHGGTGSAKNLKKSASLHKKGKPAPDKHFPRQELPLAEQQQLVALFNARHYVALESRARLLTEHYPQSGFAWKILGVSLGVQGKEALTALQKAAQLLPDDPESHSNLGNALRMLGRLDEAVVSCRRAIQIKPDYADAHLNLGIALRGLGHWAEAVTSYRQALAIKPNGAEAHNNLGNALTDLGQLHEAVASYRRAIALKPDYSEAHNNLGNALTDLGQLDDAVASYQRAIALKPDYAEAHSNLGNTLKVLDQRDEAVASYRRAIEIKPDLVNAHSNLLCFLSHKESIDAQSLFAEYCRFAEQFETPLRGKWPRHTNSRNPERCLQVGFVSADLYNHTVASFIEPVLAHLAGFPLLSLHAYYNHPIEDSVTQRLRGHVPHWHSVVGLSDEALAQKIRADRIDLLIDLSGHTWKNRLLCFARKAAPVQISWMGFPGTTGLSAMDYYLSDRYFLPPGQFDDQFTEKIVRLPASAPFLPLADAPPVNDLPAVKNGYLTFGSFNRMDKLSPAVIALWAQLLRSLPDARMVLGGMPQAGKFEVLIEWFTQEGISADRLTFYPRSGMQDYLALHHQVDICLDTFPYSGGTTTLHAIWMGVPTISLAGGTAAGRTGVSILGHVGLDAFVAHSKTEFVGKGVHWANQLSELVKIRDGLRVRFGQSAPGHPEIIAAALERALRIMWQRWCAGLPAESFEVLAQNSGNAMQEANT